MAWEKVTEYTNPAWYGFSGEYTKAVVTFKTGPEQLTWVLTDPLGQWLGDQVQREARDRGQTILFYSLSKNTDPTWTTEWQIDMWGYGSPLLIVAIVVGALAALGIAYLTFKIVSSVQVTKRAEIQQETEQARVAFVEKYEPEYGSQVFDWLDGITKPPPEVTDPSLLDHLKKALPGIGIGAGALIVIGLALFLFMGRR